jgi:hypothetical protein
MAVGSDLTRGKHRSRTTWHARPGTGGSKAAALELAQFNGEVLYASGETALYAGVEVIDFADEREPFQGSLIIVLRDGSISTQRIAGVVTARQDMQRVSGTGTWEFVSGTGRFAGLTGGGTFTWSADGDEYSSEFSGE